ncbi:creatininase family protein [Paenibacillaceae bacterium WGS1546]|uniref:creatininase family protein n=1 Tax=Cohnella sp. WGS1546 TaxID=3366810 RepID=UPI00372D19D8
MKPSTGNKTRWAEMLPYEFKRRLDDCPIVYLPLGLCEPHGQISAFGLDTIKAEWLCERAAERVGGVVAPTMGYHIHETGYHARWLEEEVGEENPRMTGMPPDVYLRFFLYQLRAFVNAGFRGIVVVSGHSGGNQHDLRLAAEAFMRRVPADIWVRSDPELVEGLYEGDHAGKYEISQLMFIRPELVQPDQAALAERPGSGGRLALGGDALEASAELGRTIMEACLERIVREASRMKQEWSPPECSGANAPRIPYSAVEEMWQEVLYRSEDWITARPWPSQQAVSQDSKWKPYECYWRDKR